MIYSNGNVIKSKFDQDYDALCKLSMESYLYTLKNYNRSLEGIIEAGIQPSQSLCEAVNIKEAISNMAQAIKNVFHKIIEVIRSAYITINSALYASDQLITCNADIFKDKVDNFGKYIKYKILIPNRDILSENGSDYTDIVIDEVQDVVDKFISSDGINNILENVDIENTMNSLRGKLLNTNPITQAEFKKQLSESMFVEKEGTGISNDLYNDIIQVMSASPEIIQRSWNKSAEKQMRELLNSVNKLNRKNKDKDDNFKKSIAQMNAYINGSLHIITAIHHIYIIANIKLIKSYRKIFLKVIRSFPNNKKEQITIDTTVKEDE